MFRGLFIVSLVFLGGCQFFQPKEESTEVPVARVNETFLYESDLAGLIAAGTTTEDSTQFAERFINNWIRKQLIIDKAQNELDLNEAEIEQKVLDYRYALTRSAFEKQYIFENLEESVSEEEIQQQKQSFNALIQELGRASSSEIRTALAERETVPRETDLDLNTVALLQKKIQDATKAPQRTDNNA